MEMLNNKLQWQSLVPNRPPISVYLHGKVETEFLQSQEFPSLVWFRYKDNFFHMILWEEKFWKIHLWVQSRKIAFSHHSIKLPSGTIATDLHSISIIHSFILIYIHGISTLQFSSSHPEKTKRSKIYSQTFRISRLCSLEKDFAGHAEVI